jgi:hypothetical protein
VVLEGEEERSMSDLTSMCTNSKCTRQYVIEQYGHLLPRQGLSQAI